MTGPNQQGLPTCVTEINERDMSSGWTQTYLLTNFKTSNTPRYPNIGLIEKNIEITYIIQQGAQQNMVTTGDTEATMDEQNTSIKKQNR
jgi:hypothetical protein